MKVKSILLTFILTALALLPPAARADDWTWRGWLAWVSPTGSLDVANEFGDILVDVESSLGFGLEVERRFGERSGLAFGLSTSQPTLDLRFTASVPGAASFAASDDLRMTTVSASWNLHLTPQGRLDLFIGPEVAWTTFGDLSAGGLSTSVSEDFGLGARLGLDAPVGTSGWAFHAALRWLDLGADLDEIDAGTSSIDLSPWSAHLGFARSF